MRIRQKKASIALASISALALSRFAWAGPAYDIYPIPAGNGSNTVTGDEMGISPLGTYATAVYQSGVNANGVLYNVPSGTSTLESQSGIIESGTRGTYETTGVPAAVNEQGVMFGSSGLGSLIETGEPTVWQNGQAYGFNGFKTPSGAPVFTNAGQIEGASNYNPNFGGTLAVGAVGSPTGSLDQAAAFYYVSPTSTANEVINLTAPISATIAGSSWNGTMTDAKGISAGGIVVGTSDNGTGQSSTGVQYAALSVPFIYDLGTALTTGNPGTAYMIPNSTTGSSYGAVIPFAISNNSSYVVGSQGNSAFIYNVPAGNLSGGQTVTIPLAPGTSFGEARGVNDSGEVVGNDSSAYSVPFLYDGTNTYALGTLLVNNTSGAWTLDTSTYGDAYSIADNGDIVGIGLYNGKDTAFIMIPTGGVLGTAQNLTWNNAGGTGDGVTWDTTNKNWNNGSGATTFSSTDGDNVTFNDNNNGNYNVSIPATVTPGQVVFNNSAGNYTLSGAGGISGTPLVYKYGTGTLTIDTVNTYTTPTNVFGGTVVLGVKGALPSTSVLMVSGTANVSASVVVASLGAPYALTLASVEAYSNGSFDLTNNALVLTNDSLSGVTGMLKVGIANGAWNGYSTTAYPGGITYSGIISSKAGASNPLMAIGAIVDDNGSGTPLYGTGGKIASTFDGATPVDGNILVKYTYYGDANLDGKVDGSDYSRIDAAAIADAAYYTANPTGTSPPATGWYNGDFNYDGYVNGSDYTLIDNAYNTQGPAISSEVAGTTVEIAGVTASVPEPASVALLACGSVCLLRRRRRARAAVH